MLLLCLLSTSQYESKQICQNILLSHFCVFYKILAVLLSRCDAHLGCTLIEPLITVVQFDLIVSSMCAILLMGRAHQAVEVDNLLAHEYVCVHKINFPTDL